MSGFKSMVSETPRDLTEDDLEKMKQQTCVTDFKKKKLELEARKNWDMFYKRNKDNFFKDRNWSSEDLKDLCVDIDLERDLVYLEAGCGVGNMLFPVAEKFPKFHLLAFDFSQNAVSLLEKRAEEVGISVETDVVDLSVPSSSSSFTTDCDIATLIFVLSAIHPDKHKIAAQNMTKYVKIGGSVIIRDYAINDYAMVRFKRDTKIADRFYVRQDGTRAYYFTLEELQDMFVSCGFECKRKEYLTRETVNLVKNLKVPRMFVQARFVRIR